MILDIIVTHYNEPYEVVKPFFDMLELQRMIDFSDFRVILVHDGMDCSLPELSERSTSFPFEFIEINIHHKGVSAARNAGLYYSDAEWVMFCDCDDSFANRHSLSEYITALDKKEFQIIWAPFYMEVGIGEHKRFIADKFDVIRLVGKVFQRKFLLENDFHFSEDLWVGEDMSFMALVLKTISRSNDKYKIGEIEASSPLYTVVPYADSVTHKFENRFHNAVGVFRKELYMLDELQRRGFGEESAPFAVRAMTDAYFTLCRTDLTDDRSEFDKEVWEFYKTHRCYIDTAGDDVLRETLTATRNEFIGTLTSDQFPMAYKDWLPLWVKHHEELENEK